MSSIHNTRIIKTGQYPSFRNRIKNHVRTTVDIGSGIIGLIILTGSLGGVFPVTSHFFVELGLLTVIWMLFRSYLAEMIEVGDGG